MGDIYMVANLILLCSLKIYLFLKLGNNFARKHGLSYSFFLQAGIGVPIVLDILDTCPFFQFFLFLFHFINNFYIARCILSAIKLLRDNNKNLEHLFGVYPIGYIFGVHS
jgi:hypothetical protein